MELAIAVKDGSSYTVFEYSIVTSDIDFSEINKACREPDNHQQISEKPKSHDILKVPTIQHPVHSDMKVDIQPV